MALAGVHDLRAAAVHAGVLVVLVEDLFVPEVSSDDEERTLNFSLDEPMVVAQILGTAAQAFGELAE